MCLLSQLLIDLICITVALIRLIYTISPACHGLGYCAWHQC